MRFFYYLSSCDSCKRIRNELSLDESIIQIDIKKSPITNSRLEQIHAIAGSYEALFSKRAQLYKQRNLKSKDLTELDYRALILENYTFLKRPVLLFDNVIFIGNSPKVIAEANTFLNEQ